MSVPTADALSRERRASIRPPASHQTDLPPERILHSANCGVILLRSGIVRAEHRERGRRELWENVEAINTHHAGEVTAFLYDEAFGLADRVHLVMHLRTFDGRYLLEESGHGAPSAELFVDGSVRETLLLPQFWGMYGTKVDGTAERATQIYRAGGSTSVPPALEQTAQPGMLHSASAGLVLHRRAQVIYDFRSEARRFGRTVAESINDNLAGEATVFVYEEAFGSADRLHWFIHLRDLVSYQRVLELHVRNEAVRDMYFEPLIDPAKGGGTWARMFVEGSMVDLAMVPRPRR